jgi:transcriptional regulator with XRE-family HTH domain
LPAVQQNWKARLGARLKELRQSRDAGEVPVELAARTIDRTKQYVHRLENSMEKENPSLDMLEKLVTLYGKTMGDLFEVIVEPKTYNHVELHDRLDFLLKRGPDRLAIAISENVIGMYDRAVKLRREEPGEGT